MTERFDPAERLRYFRRFGGQALSYSTLQPDMRYFDLDGVGYLAYRVKYGRRYVLGDPVCAPGDRHRLIERFLAEGGPAVFLPVQPDSADLLHEAFGFYATQIGCETRLDLASWSPTGRRMRNFRRAARHAERSAIAVAEEASVDPAELRAVALAWRRGRSLANRWLDFVSRPFDVEPADGVRRFLARQNGRLVGYVLFDPIFADGRVVAYGPSLSAFTPDFRDGLYYVVLEQAARRFRDEGVAAINLGLSPLDIVAPDFPFESRLLRAGLAGLRLTGDRLYNFAGLSFIKRKFYGAQTPVFAAHQARLPALELFGFLRLSGIV